MADIRLIGIVPPPPVQTVAQPSVVQQTTTQGASILAQIPTGSVLSGFIVNRDASGNPILRTDSGDVAFTSSLFLKIGAEVVIRIQNNNAGVSNAHLVSVNGQPPEVAAAEHHNSSDPEVIVSAKNETVAAQPSAKLPAIGTTLSAIIVTPTANAAAANLPELAPGTALQFAVLGTETPTRALPPNAPLNALTPNNMLSAHDVGLETLPSSSTQTPAATTQTTQAATLPVDTAKMPVSIPASPKVVLTTEQKAPVALNNAQAAKADLAAPLGQSLVATVLPHAVADEPVLLQTSLGVIRIAQPLAAPAGTQLQVRVTSVTAPNSYTIALANATQPEPAAELPELAKQWSSLQQIVHILGDENLPSLIPNLPSVSPTPGQPNTVGNQLLFFLSALKGGDFEAWLGKQSIKILEDKGYGPLLRKAEGEFMTIAKQWAEPQQTQNSWQSFFFPVAVAGELQQVRAFVKRDRKDKNEETPEGGEDTRFVLEMELSQLGEMQMDGLVQRSGQNLQFDLMIRSHHPLPSALQTDIQDIFQSTAELTGYRGQIMFQAIKSFPVNPMEDTLPHPMDDVLA